MYTPIKHKVAINGAIYGCSVSTKIVKAGTNAVFKTSNIIFATTNPAIAAQIISPDLSNIKDSGFKPSITNAPNKIAVVPEPGIPKLNNGMSAPPTEALFADSGPLNP